MLTVNKADVTLSSNNSLVTEASQIGIAPGSPWPDHIAVIDDHNSGFLFQRGNSISGGDDFYGYNYFSREGFVLTVFND